MSCFLRRPFSPFEEIRGEIVSISCVKEILTEFPLNQDSLEQAVLYALVHCIDGIDNDPELSNVRFIKEASEIVREFKISKSVLNDRKYLEALNRYIQSRIRSNIGFDGVEMVLVVEHLHPNLEFVKTWDYQNKLCKKIIELMQVFRLRLSDQVYNDYNQLLKLLPSSFTLQQAQIEVVKRVLIADPERSTGILEKLIERCGISGQTVSLASSDAIDYFIEVGIYNDALISLLKITDSKVVNRSLLRRPYASFKLLEKGILGDTEMEKYSALRLLKRLSGLKYPSSNADNDSWRKELNPLMQHFLMVSSMIANLDPIDAKSQDIFCDYVNRFGMLNLPKLFELHLAVSRLASPSELNNPEYQKLRDILQVILKKDPATFSGSKAILNGLKSYKDTFTARLVKCDQNALRRLQSELEGSVIAKELFRSAIGTSQFSIDDDPVYLVKTLVSKLESEPEKFELKAHEVECEIQVSVVRASTGGDVKEGISIILAGGKYQEWRETIVGALKKAKGQVIDVKEIVNYFREGQFGI